MDLRIHRLPDQFLVSSGVQSFVHLLADRQQCFPIRLLLGVALWNSGIAQEIVCRLLLEKKKRPRPGAGSATASRGHAPPWRAFPIGTRAAPRRTPGGCSL